MVLPHLRHHLGRERDGEFGKFLADDAADPLFVRRVAVGVEEANRHRLDPFRQQRAQRRADGGFVQSDDDIAVAVHSLGHFQAEVARDQWFGKAEEQVVDVVALLRAHLEHVAEPGGSEQAELGPLALDDRVGDERGAVHDFAYVGERDVGHCDQLLQSVESGDRRIMRGG